MDERVQRKSARNERKKENIQSRDLHREDTPVKIQISLENRATSGSVIPIKPEITNATFVHGEREITFDKLKPGLEKIAPRVALKLKKKRRRRKNRKRIGRNRGENCTSVETSGRKGHFAPIPWPISNGSGSVSKWPPKKRNNIGSRSVIDDLETILSIFSSPSRSWPDVHRARTFHDYRTRDTARSLRKSRDSRKFDFLKVKGSEFPRCWNTERERCNYYNISLGG